MRARRSVLISLALFGLNAALCWPLFRIEYLDDFNSNEGSFITFGAFLARYWPNTGWFPWFNAGMPFENTYLPLTAALVAIVARVAHCSPAHAFHFIAALGYSLAPVFLFLFARELSGRTGPSAWAALVWSLLSLEAVFPFVLHDMGTPFGLRRLQNIVFYGETPHNLALCLLPLSLWLTARYLDARTMRRFALAVIGAAAVMLANAFGMVVVSVSTLMVFATRGKLRLKDLVAMAGVLGLAYLSICRFFPPSLIRLVENNAQLVGGDYRYRWTTVLFAFCFVSALIGLWALARRFFSSMLQFAMLFSACFGGVVFLGRLGISLLPQPERYQLEVGMGLSLLVAFSFEPIIRRSSYRLSVAVVCIAALAWMGFKDYRFARRLIHPADAAHAWPITEAHWMAANLPGERVLIAGDGQWMFNLFADNPQLGAGHEPSAPNWMQRVAVYIVYTLNDAPTSILWLQAYGCGAVQVPGPASGDYYHAIANPAKFDGVLPLVWQGGGDFIYRVPQRSASLAHVIPRSAIVARRPLNGLDVAVLRPYVAALEDASLPAATLSWDNPDHGRITANVPPGDVISLQETWDPGWQARVAGRRASLTADPLGLMVIDPRCPGQCTIDLEFTGGPERRIALIVTLLAAAGLLAMLVVAAHDLLRRWH